jgi:23S rRNA pseudouridine1911/1915/1917 synthase
VGPEITTEIVPAALDGERLDRVVSLVTGCSRSAATNLIAAGAVRIGPQLATSGKVRVTTGDAVTIDEALRSEDRGPQGEPDLAVPIVHADPDVIVVDKPAGLVVHPGSGHPSGTLVNGLLARYPELAAVGDRARPGIVHRLDKDTTGLLVVARTPGAYEALVGALGRREVERDYVALVWGHPEAARGVIDAPLGRSARKVTKMAVTVEGKEARTRYDVQRTYGDPVAAALLDCRLETGRTHQIRVHLAAIGHPVVGDRDYGGVRPGLGAARPMLHAQRLAFVHPGSGERVTFTSPLPEDMAAVLAELA